MPATEAAVPLLPMLACAGDRPPGGGGWAFEAKWDGVRAVAEVGPAGWRLTSRRGLEVTSCYPELDELAQLCAEGAVLDGEIVALDESSRPDFSLLQRRIQVSDRRRAARLAAAAPVSFFAFDLCRLGDRWLLDEPYHRRRQLLEALGVAGEHLATPAALGDDGELALEVASSCGLEGVVAKRRDSPYVPGRRSASWVKLKLVSSVEVVVCGYVPGRGRRSATLGALVVAVPAAGGGWRYAGRVGTGFSEADLVRLARMLAPLEQCGYPLGDSPPSEVLHGPRWVRPLIVGEVAFQQWTPAGQLRAPRWRGLRPDLDPGDLEPPETGAAVAGIAR